VGIFWRDTFLFRLLKALGMPKNRPRLDWSRPLPRTLIIPEIMTLTTLADVQALLQHLPEPANLASRRQRTGQGCRWRRYRRDSIAHGADAGGRRVQS
jgi:hypothetical protein